jgi:hypothetical protein
VTQREADEHEVVEPPRPSWQEIAAERDRQAARRRAQQGEARWAVGCSTVLPVLHLVIAWALIRALRRSPG